MHCTDLLWQSGEGTSWTVQQMPRSRPGRAWVCRHRNEMAPHSAGRGACGTFTPNQRFQVKASSIRDLGLSSLLRWSPWRSEEKCRCGARASAAIADLNCLRERPDLREWFLPEILGLPNKKIYWSMFTQKEKKEKERKTEGRSTFLSASMTFLLHPATAANCCYISCHCRRLSSAQGKWNGQTARKRDGTGTEAKKRELPCSRTWACSPNLRHW